MSKGKCPLCGLEKEGNLYVPFGFICLDCDKVVRNYNDRVGWIKKELLTKEFPDDFKIEKGDEE